MIFPENFEDKVGFSAIKIRLKQKCLSALGRKDVDAMQFNTAFKEINTLLLQTYEFKQICLFEEQFPEDHYFDLTETLQKIRVEGTFLEENQLFDLKRSLESIKSILNFFKNHREEYPELFAISGDVKVYPFILDRINKIITNHGKIKDNASPGLQQIRKESTTLQAAINKKIQQILKRAQSDGIIESDTSITFRNGRPVIPVSSTNKRQIKGIIQDESSSGKTVFIEPTAVIELNNDLRNLNYAEKREIHKILISFCDDIRPYLKDLLAAYYFLGRIDFIRAKALLAIELDAFKPQLFDEPLVEWKKAIHPLLYLSHKKENKEVVPQDILLEKKNRILIISGPNAGGKSVCLQTAGLLQYMVQCGLLIPMNENSRVGIFKKIFIDIGDEQSIENDLSTYSSHLLNMKFFLKNSDAQCLVLIDEFGAGTEPNIGGSIAESILEELNQKECFGIITTHYSNLKHMAANTPGIINGAMLYDAHQMQPLFKLLIGKPGSSFAYEIARKIGLPEQILQNAATKVGKDQVSFDKHLREILRDKRYWEEKRQSIRRKERNLEEITEKYEHELRKIKTLRNEIIDRAKNETESIVSGLNKTIEKTIREIKESNAAKEKTKLLRKQLEEEKRQALGSLESSDKNMENELNNIRKIRKKPSSTKHLDNQKQKTEKEKAFEPGDKVKIKGQDIVGEIIDTTKQSVMVAFGNMITTVDKTQLTKTKEKELTIVSKKNNLQNAPSFNIHERRLNFKPEIDVRGNRVEEVVPKITSFLDDAYMCGCHELRILHGKGNGILRLAIRDLLQSSELVKSYHDEHVERGGSGITVINMNLD